MCEAGERSGGPRGRRAAPGGRARLDAEMVARGLAETRSKAQGLILAGRVLVDGVAAAKCGVPVRTDQEIALAPAPRPFVSRGGEKLAGALDELGVSVEDAIALDVGASTGGFTDCLLRRGARRVYALDVGRALIADSLRRDPRVTVLDGVNFRHADPGLVPEKVSLATVDVSFISLRLILAPLLGFLRPGADVVALVKPQFEAGRKSVGKGGVVRDDKKRREAVETVKSAAREAGYEVLGQADSRVFGPKGNREIVLWLRRPGKNALDTPTNEL